MRGVPVVSVFVLLALLAGCSAPAGDGSGNGTGTGPGGSGASSTTSAPPVCPQHWHATFAIFLPGGGSAPMRVDFASPRTPKGNIYYDLSSGATAMTHALHMHQVGDETGSPELGAAQWHMESNECTSVAEALRIVEVEPSASSLRLTGGHTQVAGQSGTFTATADAPLRWWVQSKVGGAWTWNERTWLEVQGYQLKDGESLLVALGSYSAGQVTGMQAQVPAPVTRT